RLARALGRSSADAELHHWGALLLLAGAIIFACQTAGFVVGRLAPGAGWARWIVGTVQFVLLGLAFRRHRPGTLLPTTAAERQLWSIWIGYFLAFGTVALISWQLPGAGAGADRPLPSLWSLYPYSAVLAGLAFFVMGSAYWGGCYLIGLA